MKIFMYVQYLLGIHKVPDMRMCWSSDPLLRVPPVADMISKNRFEKLMQYFHLNDNSKMITDKKSPGYDPLFKIRPLMEMVRTNSRSAYMPNKHLSIDEAMIKFDGRLFFKQYVKGKPNPWGIKVWCLCDPATGFLIDFDPYLGSLNKPQNPDHAAFGLGYQVVMQLASKFLDKGYQLYYDNFFSSVQLAQDLEKRGTSMCSTIRVKRKGWPADLKDKMKPGTVLFRQAGNLVATLWRDKRPVSVLSTTAQPEMVKVQKKLVGGGSRRPRSQLLSLTTTSTWAVLISLIRTAPTIQWEEGLCAGGDTCAGSSSK